MVIDMNKRTVRAFALGILFAAIIFGVSPFILGEKDSLDLEKARTILEEQGYIVMAKSDYEKLEENKKDSIKQDEKGKAEQKNPKEEEEEKDQGEAEETQPVVTYQLVIASGMNTEEISKILEKEKIIDDQYQFEQYLIDHDYSTKVQVGSFELNSKMDYGEIGKIITKTKK